GRVYGAAPVEESGMGRILADYLTRARNLDDLLACVGREVASVAEADRSRADADLVLGAARHASRSGTVTGVADVLADILALHSADVLDGLRRYSPLTALERFDHSHNADLVASVQAYLHHGGDVADAAASLHVHPNT